MELTFDNEVYYTDKCGFVADIESFTKYLKGKYSSNLARCKGRLIDPLRNKLTSIGHINSIPTIDMVERYWNLVEPYTYKEAFEIPDQQFKAIVFSSINILEMIENLGATRIKTEGIELVNKKYNEITKSFTDEPYHYIAELYTVSGEKIGITNEKLYVVKVWCTSTNQEHWLWVDENSCDINSPLDAIASTCIVYEPMIDHIKHIIRQGDVFLFEMNDSVKIKSTDNKIRLSKDKYFELLKSQA